MGKIRSTNRQPEQGPSVDAEIDQVLQNWGTWAGVRMGRRRQASAMFRMAGRGTRRECALVSVAVDVDQAWRVEKTVCNPNFSPRFREVLTRHYVTRETEMSTCRLLGLHLAAYDHELWRAATYFWNRYQRDEVAAQT